VITRDQLGNDLVAWINYQPLVAGHLDALADAF
jgi:hypothetical protein